MANTTINAEYPWLSQVINEIRVMTENDFNEYCERLTDTQVSLAKALREM